MGEKFKGHGLREMGAVGIEPGMPARIILGLLVHAGATRGFVVTGMINRIFNRQYFIGLASDSGHPF